MRSSPVACLSSLPPAMANAAFPNRIATARPSRSRSRWTGSNKCCRPLWTAGRIKELVPVSGPSWPHGPSSIEQFSELGHERLVRHVQSQRRDGDPILSQRENIAAVRGLLSTDSHIGDPVIVVAATVLPRLDLQPVLAVAALVRHRDALDLSGRVVGKIDVDEHVARYPGCEHAPDDIRCEPDRGLPVGWLAAAGLIGLRERDGGNAENGPLDRTGDGA